MSEKEKMDKMQNPKNGSYAMKKKSGSDPGNRNMYKTPEEKRAEQLIGLRKKRKHRQLVLMGSFLVCMQAACDLLLMIRTLQAGFFPAKYMLALIGCLVIFLGLSGFLVRFRSEAASRRRLIAGIVLSLVVIAASCIGTFAVMKAGQTIDAVSSGGDQDSYTTTAVVGVYVMEDDAAQDLKDTKNYIYGRLGSVDGKNTTRAVKYLRKQLGDDLDVRKKGSAGKLINSLYDGEVQAVVLNTGYMDLLGESADYYEFNEKTRMIAKIKVVSKIKVDKELMDGEKVKSDIVRKPFVVYLSGSDTRKKELSVGRSDVNILMVVDPVGKQVLLVNTPRDFYVGNPAAHGRMDKLTHCASYGLDNTIKTLSNLYDVDIDYYAQINFTGFEKLIDAMGGITVESDVSFDSDELTVKGYHFKKGKNKLDGKGALSFARDRHNQLDGDYARGRHQMAVIEAIIAKATSKKTILMNYSDIMDSLQGMFITDLSSKDIRALIKMQLNDMSEWNVHSCPVLGTDSMAVTYSMPGSQLWVSIPIKSSVQRAKDLIEKVQNGEEVTDSDVGKADESKVDESEEKTGDEESAEDKEKTSADKNETGKTDKAEKKSDSSKASSDGKSSGKNTAAKKNKAA